MNATLFIIGQAIVIVIGIIGIYVKIRRIGCIICIIISPFSKIVCYRSNRHSIISKCYCAITNNPIIFIRDL
jgi:hypothetical protein